MNLDDLVSDNRSSGSTFIPPGTCAARVVFAFEENCRNGELVRPFPFVTEGLLGDER